MNIFIKSTNCGKNLIGAYERYGIIVEDTRNTYHAMSQKAIERVVTDSSKAMLEIIDKIQNSPLFF